MEAYVKSLVIYLQAHPGMGFLAAFLIALAESLPIIGTIVPGSLTMTAVGTLIGATVLPGAETILAAVLGALLGDSLGYWLGYYYHENIRDIWPFRRYTRALDWGEQFFAKHGGKSVIIGRFVGVVRSTVPLIAGTLRMRPWRFVFAAIPSAILWAILYLLPGILIGALALNLPASEATEFVLIGFGLVVLLWLIFWAIQRCFSSIAGWVNHRIDNSWDWLNRHHASQPAIRLITNQRHPDDHHQLTLTISALLCLLIFGFIYICVITQSGITSINRPIFYLLQSLHTSALTEMFLGFTLTGKSIVILSSSLLISAGLAWMKQWRAALHLIILVGVTTILVFAFKYSFYSPRPTGFMHQASSSSFPSGHTGISFVFFAFLGFLTAQKLSKATRFIPYCIAGIIIAGVGLSRLYLGAHWATDVLGSTFLGLACLQITVISYHRSAKAPAIQPLSNSRWFSLIIIGLAIPASIYAYTHYAKVARGYTPKWPASHVTVQQWWKNPLRYVPSYRQNRFGVGIQPFNVQWADKLSVIKQRLEKAGWTVQKESRSLQSLVLRLSNHNPKYHAPILPWLYQEHPPAVVLVKPRQQGKPGLVELRLWKSQVYFTDQKQLPLWLGAINYHRPPKQLVNLHPHRQFLLSGGAGVKQLSASLAKQNYKIISIPMNKQPESIRKQDWNGKVIVINQ